ncbi:MAG: hypothetical protein ACFFE5_03665 [Candidatus Thorarchaeota archaeon]
MISEVLIIMSGGILCYSKTFFGHIEIDDNFVSEFFTAIHNISQQIGGGEIRSLNFRNFNIIYSYDDEKYCIFTLLADINDPEEEIREKLELMINEFIKRYKKDIINWNSDISQFESFDEFVEEQIYIPPKILLVGKVGVGKTKILDLFPGELIIELDDDMNEIIQKTISLSNEAKFKECILRELDLEELVNHSKLYQQLLGSVDICCLVTSSGATNLTSSKKLFKLIKPKIKNGQVYVIANFQDMKNISFEPHKIEDFFGEKTYGFSTIVPEAKENMYSIINEMLNTKFKELSLN